MTDSQEMPQCPECAAGKPRNCAGWALTDDDQVVACAFAD